MHPITVLSFGYLHPWPEGVEKPSDENTYDLRTLRDPAHMPQGNMLDKTGLDFEVHLFVLATKGAQYLLDDAVQDALKLGSEGPSVMAFGCAGGRHRSVVFAEAVASVMRQVSVPVSVEHLHVHLPRVIRDEAR